MLGRSAEYGQRSGGTGTKSGKRSMGEGTVKKRWDGGAGETDTSNRWIQTNEL